MLKNPEETQRKSWKDHVQKLVYAYNCTKHSTKGYAPYLLLFGRKSRLPIDFILERTYKTTQQMIGEIRWAYKILQESIQDKINKFMLQEA